MDTKAQIQGNWLKYNTIWLKQAWERIKRVLTELKDIDRYIDITYDTENLQEANKIFYTYFNENYLENKRLYVIELREYMLDELKRDRQLIKEFSKEISKFTC